MYECQWSCSYGIKSSTRIDIKAVYVVLPRIAKIILFVCSDEDKRL
jgi:hypothetical protein